MSTLTAEQTTRTTGFRYVLRRTGKYPYSDRTVASEDVSGTVEDLTAGLRPWLLAYLTSRSRDNGWYIAYLVTEDAFYDPYHAVADDDVIWYWDEEWVPLSRFTDSGTP
jgi:hypothetical protein